MIDISKLIETFCASAAATPDKQALWCDGQSIPYADLASQVNRRSGFLLSCGIGRA